MKRLDPSLWYDIPGYPEYEITVHGEIRRKLSIKSSKHTITPRIRGRYYFVSLTVDKIRRLIPLHRLVGITFLGPLGKGECYYHKNHDTRDNYMGNIGKGTMKEIQKKFSQGKRAKTVLKLDENREIVEVYKSLTEAAKKNFFSIAEMSRILNNRRKRTEAPYFVFDEDKYWKK